MKRRRLLSERLRVAMELFELGEKMLRQKLRRDHPSATESEIDAKVAEWLERRPGAEHGDAPGRPLPWPER
ncbi:MAG: hypothetical protein KatS3mg076_1398 [Candidatus Binatia bacterium]|nr:MAG: hypothetical protein KatS3mg076_1398 [Candidatus Binatia bacterium]